MFVFVLFEKNTENDLVVPSSGATIEAPGCQGLSPSVYMSDYCSLFGWLAAAWPVSDTYMFGWPFFPLVLCQDH